MKGDTKYDGRITADEDLDGFRIHVACDIPDGRPQAFIDSEQDRIENLVPEGAKALGEALIKVAARAAELREQLGERARRMAAAAGEP